MLKRRDIAELTGCSVTLVVNWENEGYLPRHDIEIGRGHFWSDDIVLNFFKTKNMGSAYAKLCTYSGRNF